MSEGPESPPRWFLIVYRLLATMVLLGLAAGIFNDVYGLRISGLLGASLLMSLGGSVLFILAAWFGVAAKFLNPTKAAFYSAFFVIALLATLCTGLMTRH